MKTVLAFVTGVVAGVAATLLSIAVYVTIGDDTNHNGYELQARERGESWQSKA